MIDYYPHDHVEPKLPVPSVQDELALFGGSGSLVVAAEQFGQAYGYHVVVFQPGDDVLSRLLYLKQPRVMAILMPGVYRELTYHMPPTNADLWLYGVPGESYPQIRGHRPIGSKYGISNVLHAGAGKRLMLENLEFSGFVGNPISQSAEGTLLTRNVFMHSNGGYALFRGVGGQISPNLGSTYLIDSEFRDSGSHTVYLDYGGDTVVSGCHISRQQKSSHTIKNISQRTLVEGSTFATGIDGKHGFDDTNSWAYIDDNPLDPREYGGSACYDGMSGTEFSLLRNNRFVMPPSSSPFISLQTRSSASGNHMPYPAPGIGLEGMAKAHRDACARYMGDPTVPSALWEDQYWHSYEARQHYLTDNRFELTGNLNGRTMIGVTVAHNHPVTWGPSGGERLAVSTEWLDWLADKLSKRVMVEVLYRGNLWPADLAETIDWRHGVAQTYAALPTQDMVVRELVGDSPDPESVSPMLRRWTGVDLVRLTANEQPEPAEPVAIPEPEPTPEPPVVVITPPVDPTPPPIPDEEPDAPAPISGEVVIGSGQNEDFWIDLVARYTSRKGTY